MYCKNLLCLPFRCLKYFYEQKNFYKEAKLSNDLFFERYSDLTKRINLGVSWSNKYFVEKINLSSKKEQKVALKSALKFLVEDLGFKYFRLKLGWDEVELKSGKLCIPDNDIVTFEYLFSQNVEITLNIGPIKTFRYPEIHLPQRIFNKLNIPLNKQFIFNSNNPIALEAYEYLENLCVLISSEFNKELISKLIKVIQLDNEPKSRFGMHKWLLSDDYMFQTYQIAKKYFPNQKFLINSPFIPFDITEILQPDIKLCSDFIKKASNKIKIDFIIGINFYNYVPNILKIPILNIYPDNYSIFESLYGSILQLKDILPLEYQVTESQFEPWGDKYPFNIPGKSLEHLKYSLLRHLYKLTILNSSITKVYLWGGEEFALNQKNNVEIIDFIRLINY